MQCTGGARGDSYIACGRKSEKGSWRWCCMRRWARRLMRRQTRRLDEEVGKEVDQEVGERRVANAQVRRCRQLYFFWAGNLRKSFAQKVFLDSSPYLQFLVSSSYQLQIYPSLACDIPIYLNFASSLIWKMFLSVCSFNFSIVFTVWRANGKQYYSAAISSTNCVIL